MASLLKVFHTERSKDEDYHRFSCLEKADSYDKVGRLIQGWFCSLHHTLKNAMIFPFPQFLHTIN